MYDRDAKWSTSTVVVTMFLGFAIGFVCCHELYAGLDKKDLTIPEQKLYIE